MFRNGFFPPIRPPVVTCNACAPTGAPEWVQWGALGVIALIVVVVVWIMIESLR